MEFIFTVILINVNIRFDLLYKRRSDYFITMTNEECKELVKNFVLIVDQHKNLQGDNSSFREVRETSRN